MDLYAFPPIAALLDGAYAVLMALAALLEPVIGIASAAAAVVLVTLLVRAALIPVGVSQAKAEQTRARLAPKLAALQSSTGRIPNASSARRCSSTRRGHHAVRRLPADARAGADRRHDLRALHPADDRRAPERAARADVLRRAARLEPRGLRSPRAR